jgi:hypothetical protein
MIEFAKMALRFVKSVAAAVALLTAFSTGICQMGAQTQSKPSAQVANGKRVRVLKAYGDKKGQAHPATAQINAGATVTCLTARSPGPGGNTMCDVAMPGGDHAVRVGETVGATGAGTLTLNCRGQAPVSCSARVTD